MFLKNEADTSELDAARMLFHQYGPEEILMDLETQTSDYQISPFRRYIIVGTT